MNARTSNLKEHTNSLPKWMTVFVFFAAACRGAGPAQQFMVGQYTVAVVTETEVLAAGVSGSERKTVRWPA